MRIGIISDTHGHVDSKLAHQLADCDEVWHAGDIGSQEVMEFLERQKAFRAVYGNIDGAEIRKQCPEYHLIQFGKLKVMMIHIAGRMPGYTKRLMTIWKEVGIPDVLVCGHSHILRVERDRKLNVLCINPGAVGKQGFHKTKTLIKMDIHEGVISNMSAVEIGARAKSKA